MATVKWDPFSEFDQDINSLFSDAYGNIRSNSALAAATDVYSDKKALTIETHLPSFSDDEITIQQNDGELEIRAEHREKEEDKKPERKYLLRESVNRYYRRFTLPSNSDFEHIEAIYENGLLRIVIPYKELREPKRVAIRSNGKGR